MALRVWLPASRSQFRSQGSSASIVPTGKALIFWDCENVCRRSSPCFRFVFVAVFSLLVVHQRRLSDFLHNVPLKSLSMPCIRSRIYNYSPERSKAYMLLFLLVLACSWEVKNVSVALWVWLPASCLRFRSQGLSAPIVPTGKALTFWACENVFRQSSPCFRFVFVAMFYLSPFKNYIRVDYFCIRVDYFFSNCLPDFFNRFFPIYSRILVFFLGNRVDNFKINVCGYISLFKAYRVDKGDCFFNYRTGKNFFNLI